MKKLERLRNEYFDLVDLRIEEMHLPENLKTLKTPEFIVRERELLHLCAREKMNVGIIGEGDVPGKSYGLTYGKRKNGSWQKKNKHRKGKS